ncbi:WD40-repeat-containing domain protein, partial [Dimargaris cristalligena]
QATHVIKWIQLETGMARRVFRGHTGPVTSLAATHSGASSTVDLLISGSWDKTIKLWDMATGECVRTLAGHSDFIKCLALVPGGRVYRSPAGGSAKETTPWLFSGSTDATIRQWDLRTGQCVRTFPKVHSRGIDDLVYDGSTNTLFSASSDTTIRQWNIVTGQVVPPSPKTGTRVVPNDADDDDDDTELWSCSADKDIKQWCPRTGQCIITLTHPNVVKSLTVTDAHVITGCRDENIRIWSKATGKCLKVLVGHFDEITGLAVIDQTIYSTSLDGTLRKWQI